MSAVVRRWPSRRDWALRVAECAARATTRALVLWAIGELFLAAKAVWL